MNYIATAASAAPKVIEAGGRPIRFADFASERRDDIAALVLEHGAVLFRGFVVKDAADYTAAIAELNQSPMDYTYRSTPRTRVDRDIFTATEYPPKLEIPLHSENAYQRVWPMWISLCCIVPAASGGQTPIANLRQVGEAIPEEVFRRFAERGVKYIRHYRPYVDLAWEDVFQTKDRDAVARFCADNDIRHEWLDQDTLRTEQICQGVAQHPTTGQTVFFNQAHLFHPSSLDPKAAADMIAFFGRDRLPRDAKFGDGGDIDAADLDAVRLAFNASAVNLDWRQGDVAILDNMQFAHGRRPYTGERRTLAALLNPYRPPRSAGTAPTWGDGGK